MPTTTSRTEALEVARDRAEEWAPRSLAHYRKTKRIVPRGNSRGRFWWPFPMYMLRGEGAYMFDIDGHEYIDCNIGFGTLILGHAHPEIQAAVRHQAPKGLMYGSPAVEEQRLAERIVSNVPGADWVLFVGSGTDATLTALRIARAARGRDKIAKFEGGWHGWHDYAMQSFYRAEGNVEKPTSVPDSDGIPPSLSDLVVTLPYNHSASFTRIREEADSLACVIVEAVQGGAGSLPADRDFLQTLRQTCAETGVLFVLDEVITGFRFGPAGAAGLYGLTADLTTLGKVIGGGMPAGAVCGSAELADLVHGRLPGRLPIVAGGTHSANPMTMVAGDAQLDVLLRDDTRYEHLNLLGERMREGLRTVIEECNVQAQITGVGSMFGLLFVPAVPKSRRDLVGINEEAALALPSYLLREGVLMIAPIHNSFVSVAHTKDDVDVVIEAHAKALNSMRADGFFG
jgi:glutamate-1-semialdehyde 2,1-aminomutase